MPDKLSILAGIGLFIMLVAGPMAIQTGQNYEYTVEASDRLTNELEAEELSPAARTIINDALSASHAITVDPPSTPPADQQTKYGSYPGSLIDPPEPDADVDPPPQRFVVNDNGQYTVVEVALNDTVGQSELNYVLDVTAVDRTDSIVHQWEDFPTEARTVISHARSVDGEVNVYSEPPTQFRRDGYTPPRGLLGGLFTESRELVVLEDGDTDVVRVTTVGDTFGLDGVFTAIFVVGALLVVPGLTGAIQGTTRRSVAIFGATAAVAAAVAFVRVIARPPALTSPLKPFQAAEQTGVILLSVVAALGVASAMALRTSRSVTDPEGAT